MDHSLPPGSRQPRLVQLTRYLRDPVRSMLRARQRHGSVFTVRWPGMAPAVYFTDPEAIDLLFRADPEALCGGRSNRVLEFVAGARSVARLDGRSHRARRRLVGGPLGRAHDHVPRMVANAHRALHRAEGTTTAFSEISQALTLRNLIECTIGVRDPARVDRLHALTLEFMRGALHPAMAALWISLSGSRLRKAMVWGLAPLADRGLRLPFARLARTVRELDALLYAEIAERRSSGPRTDANDLLSTMALSGEMSDEDVRDEVMSMLVAGHETTSTTMDWVVVEVLSRPEVRARVEEELDAVLDGQAVDADKLERLRYLGAVISECLRLRPPVPAVGRWVEREVTLGGVRVPAGVVASVSILLGNRSPAHWDAPEAFRPERWLEGCPRNHACTPFGGGTRICPGRRFALVQLRCVMATVLSTFELTPAAWPHSSLAQRGLFTGVSHPVRVRVRKRRSGPRV